MQRSIRYRVWGWAVVWDQQDEPVTDRAILAELASFRDEEDLFATDYIGGNEFEDALVSVLERSGQIRFELCDDEELLRIRMDFFAKRRLTEEEITWLKEDTLGQWQDGMGECLVVPAGPHKGCTLRPLSGDEVEINEYPFVEVSLD